MATQVQFAPAAPPPREMWDDKKAAEYLGLSDVTVRQYAQKGLLPARKVGSRWRFYRDELENLPTDAAQ